MAGDWNVFLDPRVDQKNYRYPEKYREKTREAIKSKIRTHSLIDIYRIENPTDREYTYKDKTGTATESRLDYFLVDEETAACTTKASIEPITTPFDHSEITMIVDFNKVMRGPGFWKFNNSHLESNRFKEIIRKQLALIVEEYQINYEEKKNLGELIRLTPQQLQEIKLVLNPHETMEQIHYILKAKIIAYSIAIQKDRKKRQKRNRDRNKKL